MTDPAVSEHGSQEQENQEEKPLSLLVPGCDDLELPEGQHDVPGAPAVLCYATRARQRTYAKFDYVLYHIGCYHGTRDYPDVLLQIEREMRQALRSMGTRLCLVFDEYWRKGFRLDRNADPALRILIDDGVAIEELSEANANPTIHREEFGPLLRRYGQYKAHFQAPEQASVVPIARHGPGGQLTAFQWGSTIIVPLQFRAFDDTEQKLTIHEQLASALIAFKARAYTAPPHWASAPFFDGEADLRAELEKARTEAKQLEIGAKDLDRDKAALWLGDDPLAEEIRRLLEDEFGLSKENGYEVVPIEDCTADMWVLESGEPRVLIEVKSANRNVTKGHVYAAAGHRSENDLGDDFPVVLVINPLLAQTTNMADKRTEIHSNVVKAAVAADVVILRTIDLLDALKLLRKDLLTRQAFFESLCGQHGKGWLVVENDQPEVRDS